MGGRGRGHKARGGKHEGKFKEGGGNNGGGDRNGNRGGGGRNGNRGGGRNNGRGNGNGRENGGVNVHFGRNGIPEAKVNQNNAPMGDINPNLNNPNLNNPNFFEQARNIFNTAFNQTIKYIFGISSKYVLPQRVSFAEEFARLGLKPIELALIDSLVLANPPEPSILAENDEIRNVVLKIFDCLDQNGDHVINKHDFVDVNPKLDQLKKHAFMNMKIHLDSNADDNIDATEFLAYFVRYALTNGKPLIKHAPLADALAAWKGTFRKSIISEIHNFAKFMGDSGVPIVFIPPINISTREVGFAMNEKERVILEAFCGSQFSHTLLFREEHRSRIKAIYNHLDSHKDNQIDSNDFRHNIPAIQEQLRKKWEKLQKRLDWNGDNIVQYWEFEGYFILRALRHHPLRLNGKESMTDFLVAWYEQFHVNMIHVLHEMEQYIITL